MTKRATPPKADPRNVRVHTDKSKKAVKRSLTELGAGRSILVDKDDVVIAGNNTLAQAEALGIPFRVIETDGAELVVVKRTDLATDDPRRKTLAMADNLIADLSTYDQVAVQALNTELEATGDTGLLKMAGITTLLDPGSQNSQVGSGTETGPAGGTCDTSHVRMVQLFLDTETAPRFLAAAAKLQRRYKADNLTDAVYKAVRAQARTVKKPRR